MNIIVLLGKSGSGKDSIQNLLINELKNYKKRNYEILTLTTSRPTRENEFEGNPYYFKTQEEFLKEIENSNFIEYRKYTTLFNGIQNDWYYGIHKDSFKNNYDYIIINTPKGLKEIKSNFPEANIISFYLNVKDEIREARAKLRGSFDQIEWNRRLIEDEKDFSNIKNEVDVILNNNKDNLDKVFTKIMLILNKNNFLN